MTDDSNYPGRRAAGPNDLPSDPPLTPGDPDPVPAELAADVYGETEVGQHPAGAPDPSLSDAPIAPDLTPEGAVVDLEQSVERAAVRGGPSWPSIVGMVALGLLILWLAVISL